MTAQDRGRAWHPLFLSLLFPQLIYEIKPLLLAFLGLAALKYPWSFYAGALNVSRRGAKISHFCETVPLAVFMNHVFMSAVLVRTFLVSSILHACNLFLSVTLYPLALNTSTESRVGFSSDLNLHLRPSDFLLFEHVLTFFLVEY